MKHDPKPRPRTLHGAVGALIGSSFAVFVACGIDHFKAHLDNLWWLPPEIAVGLIGGGVIGLLLAEVTIGGREDEQADIDAQLQLRTQRRAERARG